MTELSPLSAAAQAVIDAWDAKLDPMVTCLTTDPEREALAAALQALADQVVPEWAEPIMPEGQSEALILAHMERWGNWRRSSQVRAEIFAITAELAPSTDR